ncbi:MAG: site-specific integrase [Anaerolineae bacterium]|nr:site-specific integrase [Anaerolineae bacterium]
MSHQLPMFQPASVEDLNPSTELRHTISLFQSYLLKEGKSEHTVKAFTADLHLLGEHSGEQTPIGEFTTAKLNSFLEWLEHGRGVPCSRKSYARRVTTLKVYFKWLRQVKAVADDPAKAVLQRSGPAPLATILQPDELSEALSYAKSLGRGEKPDARPETLLRLILDTGIKKGEAVRLKPEHIDRQNPEEPVLTIKHKVRNVYKERRIVLDPEWMHLLDTYLQQYTPKDDLVFDCTARNLEYVLADVSEGADLPVKISFEMLRWMCAVRDFQQGMEPDQIRDKLGLSETSWVETFAKIKRLATQTKYIHKKE